MLVISIEIDCKIFLHERKTRLHSEFVAQKVIYIYLIISYSD